MRLSVWRFCRALRPRSIPFYFDLVSLWNMVSQLQLSSMNMIKYRAPHTCGHNWSTHIFVYMKSNSPESQSASLYFCIGALCAFHTTKAGPFGPQFLKNSAGYTSETPSFEHLHNFYFVYMRKSLTPWTSKARIGRSHRPGWYLFTNGLWKSLQIERYYSPLSFVHNVHLASKRCIKPLQIHRTCWK